MPYEWIPPEHSQHRPPPVAELHAWPYRSLPRRGFVWFIMASVGLLGLPLSALIGSQALWIVLAFMALAIWAVWAAIERSYRDGEILEELTIWPDRITLRQSARGQVTAPWEANPHWIRIIVHEGHKLPHYMTLQGGPREVELAAFLTPDQRRVIESDLRAILRDLRAPGNG